MSLQDAIKERVLVLDGAMGTMIQQYGLEEKDFRGELFRDIDWQMKGNNDVLNLTRPDIIADIHRRYLEAGADIIETNTFSSQRISMADYRMENYVGRLNEAACRIARRVADEYTARNPQKPRYVVGSIGPTNKSCSMSPKMDDPSYRDVGFDDLARAYGEQIAYLIDGGVDALLVETVFDLQNAKAALYAAEEEMAKKGRKVPLMLSVTISGKTGRILSGQTLTALLASVSHVDLFSIGLNCSFGPMEMKPYLEVLAKNAPCYVSVYPNAGLPNEMGKYDVTPEQMAEQMAVFLNEGLVNIIGGCCGTTDKHIALYGNLLKDERGVWKSPRIPNDAPRHLQLSGLELQEIEEGKDGFVCIGERCNVAGSKRFLRLIKERKYDEALAICRKQIEDGAQLLDINMDEGLLDGEKEMVEFLNLIASEPDIAKLPLMIDSSNWNVILNGLKCVQGKCVVNSISLKEGEDVFLSHARDLRKMGAAVVVMAFDEEGQATSYQRKIEVCERAYRLLVDKVGFPSQDIIFDPNILTIGTGMEEHANYAIDFIRATRWIRQNLKGCHVSGGVSNLSFAFRGNNYLRRAMHAVFLYHARKEGMDMAIVNPSERMEYEQVPEEWREALEDLIFNRREDAVERLVTMAVPETLAATEKKESTPIGMNVEERLKNALAKGNEENLETDLREALAIYGSAVKVIEGPLMDGMNFVGVEFGAGRMFLPQVVKTARTMKKAVEILTPFMPPQQEGTERPKVLLATVKGDVHDIGKNIVSVVMACNGYRIIDLGVMVSTEKIVEAALKEKVDAIGLSGLITPSLAEMVNVADSLKESGISVPLMIGGATTSLVHTALKIAPSYGGPVVWVRDASQNSLVLSQLLNPDTRNAYVEELEKQYETLRKKQNESEEKLVNMDEARKNRLKLFD